MNRIDQVKHLIHQICTYPDRPAETGQTICALAKLGTWLAVVKAPDNTTYLATVATIDADSTSTTLKFTKLRPTSYTEANTARQNGAGYFEAPTPPTTIE